MAAAAAAAAAELLGSAPTMAAAADKEHVRLERETPISAPPGSRESRGRPLRPATAWPNAGRGHRAGRCARRIGGVPTSATGGAPVKADCVGQRAPGQVEERLDVGAHPFGLDGVHPSEVQVALDQVVGDAALRLVGVGPGRGRVRGRVLARPAHEELVAVAAPRLAVPQELLHLIVVGVLGRVIPALYPWRIGGCKSGPVLECMVMAHPTALPRTALGRTQRLNARCSAYAGMWCKQFKAVDARATPWAGGAETRDVPHNRPLAVRWHLQPVADDAGGWSGPGCEMLLNKGSRASGMASQKWDWGSRPGPGAAWIGHLGIFRFFPL